MYVPLGLVNSPIGLACAIVCQVTLALDDIESTVAALEANGVTFLDYTEGPLVTTGHIAQLGPARGAWFTDPDGNTLGLREG
jgi:catechol 2,3-dioxygenase-like lactoylglutathione lyase family enzyme